MLPVKLAQVNLKHLFIWSGTLSFVLAVIFMSLVLRTITRGQVYNDTFLGFWLIGMFCVFSLVLVYGGASGLKGYYCTYLIIFLILKFLLLIGVVVLLILVFRATSSSSDSSRKLWEARIGQTWSKTSQHLSTTGICELGRKSKNRLQECCTPPANCPIYIPYNVSVNYDCYIWDPAFTRSCYQCLKCKNAVYAVFLHDWCYGKVVELLIMVILTVISFIEVHFLLILRKNKNDPQPEMARV